MEKPVVMRRVKGRSITPSHSWGARVQHLIRHCCCIHQSAAQVTAPYFCNCSRQTLRNKLCLSFTSGYKIWLYGSCLMMKHLNFELIKSPVLTSTVIRSRHMTDAHGNQLTLTKEPSPVEQKTFLRPNLFTGYIILKNHIHNSSVIDSLSAKPSFSIWASFKKETEK